jgi:Holliday junction DNA helicase RuvB
MESTRPVTLNDFVGKDNIKKLLSAMIDGAKSRGETLDHVLFSGSAGLGKTTLARIIAGEMGTNIITMVGNNVDRSLQGAFTRMGTGDILFIDEIHRIKPVWQELLYSAMEDFKTSILVSGKTYEFNLNRFTLVGATTDLGQLAKPLRDRFGAVIELENYTTEEIGIIVRRNCEKLGITISENAIIQVAKRCKFTPRIAVNLVRRLRDFYKGSITDCAEAFRVLNIDEIGLDRNDRQVLRCLAGLNYPVGVGNLASACGIDVVTIERTIEPYLIQVGFLNRTPQGRLITPAGKRYIEPLDNSMDSRTVLSVKG